jgi:UDPglucose 6-dehydrogenase
MKKLTVGFTGMTHLGLVSAIASSEKSVNIIGFDGDDNLINELKNESFPISEPDLEKIYKKNKDSIFFTSNLKHLKNADIIYLSVDIKTDDLGNSDLSEIKKYLQLFKKNGFQNNTIIILSQVPPGFTRKFSKFFKNLYYQVETLVFGIAMHRSLFPERYILGVNDSRNIDPKLIKFLKLFNCPIFPMKYESAELAKISINMYLVSSVITSNTIAELCEKIGADFSEIIPTLKLDKRIGQFAYLNPGLGISGGNLERDLNTFKNFSKKFSTDSRIINSWLFNSSYRKDWPYKVLQENKILARSNLITIFGLTYKPNTHSLKNSPTIKLLGKLKNFNVQIYDPIVKDIKLDRKHVLINSLKNNLIFGDVIIIMNDSKVFFNLNKFINDSKVKYVIDPFRVIDHKKLRLNIKYFALGI